MKHILRVPVKTLPGKTMFPTDIRGSFCSFLCYIQRLKKVVIARSEATRQSH
jgi:hypothetical protein